MQPVPDKPIVCYVTDRTAFPDKTRARDLLERISGAAQAGVDWVQIREKDLSGRGLLDLVGNAIDLVRRFEKGPTRVIVNDRLDVALAAGAAGVHLGQASLPAREAVRWCHNRGVPKDFRIGVSGHSLEDARLAEAAGLDYVFFGPVFDSPSKRRFGSPQGIDKLRELTQALRIPVIAIGGVNAQNATECLHAGAAGVAAIREFQDLTWDDRARKFVEAVHRGF